MSDEEIDVWELQDMEPEEIRNKYGADEDHPVVQATGKKHFKTKIDPVLENTVLIFFSERLGNYVRGLARNLKEDINDRGDIKWEVPFGPVGIDLYQLHTMSISYFEIGAYLFVSDYLRHHPYSPGSKRLLDAIYERKGHLLTETQDYDERLRNAYHRIQTDDNLGVGFYRFILEDSEFLNEPERKALKDVNETRGDFVHDSFGLVGINEKQPVLEMVNDCQLLLEGVSDLLHEYTEYDSDFYEVFERKSDW